jgi:phosphate uptake regulator
MKRKVVKHGPSSLTVSLPMSWVKKTYLKSGDEVEVTEKGSELLISGHGKKEPREITISLNEENLAKRFFVMPYVRGYDIIKICFDSYKVLEFIQSHIDLMFGFEIIEQGPHLCKLKNVAESKPEEFESMLLRMFNICTSMLDELLGFVEKDDPDALKRIIITERTINRLDLYCRRMINMGDWGSEMRKAGSTYAVVRMLENLADMTAHIAKHSPKITKANKAQISEIVKKLIKGFEIMKKVRYGRKIDALYDYQKLEYDLRYGETKCSFSNDELKLYLALMQILFCLHDLSEEVILWVSHKSLQEKIR